MRWSGPIQEARSEHHAASIDRVPQPFDFVDMSPHNAGGKPWCGLDPAFPLGRAQQAHLQEAPKSMDNTSKPRTGTSGDQHLSSLDSDAFVILYEILKQPVWAKLILKSNPRFICVVSSKHIMGI